jgi:hypothetical protein
LYVAGGSINKGSFMKGTKLKQGLLLILVCSVLIACEEKTAEEKVTQAANERWQSLIQGDFDKAYKHYSEAYQKTVSLEHFKNRIRGVGLWSAANVTNVDCDDEGKQCTASVEVTVAVKMRGLDKPTETSTVLKETWVNEGGFSGWKFVKK